MPVRRPTQVRYNTVATNEESAAAEQASSSSSGSRISGDGAEPQQQQPQRTTASNSSSRTTYSSVPNTDNNNNNNELDDEEIELETIATTPTETDADDDTFSVTILDFTHTKFTINGLRRTDTVRHFKRRGFTVHGVPVVQQRLVYRGKLLNDADLLESVGLFQDGLIVHLFPKPRVVVVNSGNSSNASDNNATTTNHEDSADSTTAPGMARVPTIVLDADEAAQRSQILVLGSVDYIEAVNNVKLFSFMLLIISSIELMNLTAIALGNGQALGNPQPIDPWEAAEVDDFFDHDSNNTNNTNTSNFTNAGGDETLDPAVAIYETWQPLSYLDLIVSIVGVYVALLGIRASNENRSTVAQWYYWGTCGVAVGWLLFNFLISLQVDEAEAAEQEEENESDSSNNYNNTNTGSDSVYSQAFNVMLLPAMVWGMCIFRAWQFQSLLTEAEQEAAERIAAQALEINNRSRDNYDNDDDNDEELAVRGATLT